RQREHEQGRGDRPRGEVALLHPPQLNGHPRRRHVFWQGQPRTCPLGWGVAFTGELPMSRRLILAALALAVVGSLQAEVPAPRDVPYAAGTIKLEVDATN